MPYTLQDAGLARTSHLSVQVTTADLNGLPIELIQWKPAAAPYTSS